MFRNSWHYSACTTCGVRRGAGVEVGVVAAVALAACAVVRMEEARAFFVAT